MSQTQTYSQVSPREPGTEGAVNEMMQRCRPFKVGMVLILLMMLSMTFQLSGMPNRNGFLVALLSMYAASGLTLFMMFSLCEKDNATAAWATVVLSPVIIGLFSYQVSSVVSAFK